MGIPHIFNTYTEYEATMQDMLDRITTIPVPRAGEYESVQRKLAEQDLARPDGGGVVLVGVSAGEPQLVPVRLGGPWEVSESWELWVKGKFMFCLNAGPAKARQKGEYVEMVIIPENTEYHEWTYDFKEGVAFGDLEWRAPLGWTGDLPEGTCLATNFITGQRVRARYDHSISGTVSQVEDGAWPSICMRRKSDTIWTYSPDDLEGY